MHWSVYQEEIFDWGVNGTGNALVDAVPGSGKTSVLVELARRLPSTMRAKFLAFNSLIAKEIRGRLSGTGFDASTIHSMGFGALRRYSGNFNVNGDKVLGLTKEAIAIAKEERVIGNELINEVEVEAIEENSPVSAIRKLVDLYRLTLWDKRNSIEMLAWYYGVDIDEPLARFFEIIVPAIVDLSSNYAKTRKEIDFTDMIYLPVKWDMKPYPVDFLLVDEAQDMNACQLELVISACHSSTRMLFVADENQAIYGWSGAGTDSVQKTVRRTGAKRLPLSISYRCPVSHVRLAQEIVSQIEPAPDAIQGSIRYIDWTDVAYEAHPGDMVICRMTAPIVKLCFNLIRSGVAAKVLGRDIGKGMSIITRKIMKRRPAMNSLEFAEHVKSYVVEETGKIIAKHGDASESRVQSLTDRVHCAHIIWNEGRCTTFEHFEKKVSEIFGEASGPVVTLSTIHRAKGMEADRVFIVKPELMPMRTSLPWQYQQEMNVKYVSLTRAKDTMFMVSMED